MPLRYSSICALLTAMLLCAAIIGCTPLSASAPSATFEPDAESSETLPSDPASNSSAEAYNTEAVRIMAASMRLPSGELFTTSGRTFPLRRLHGDETAAWEATVAVDVASTEVPRFTTTLLSTIRFGRHLRMDEQLVGCVQDSAVYTDLGAMPAARRVSFMQTVVNLLAQPGAPLSTPARPINIDSVLSYSETHNNPDQGIGSAYSSRVLAIGALNGLGPKDIVHLGVNYGVETGDFYLIGWFAKDGVWRPLAYQHGWDAQLERLDP